MDYVRRHKIKRLVDELDDAQFDRLVDVVRSSDLQLPGWKDRLAPSVGGSPSAGKVKLSADLPDLVRGLRLSRLGSHAAATYRSGVWLSAADDRLELAGSNDYDASYFAAPAAVQTAGRVLIEQGDAFHLVETLRKALPRAEQQVARVHLRTLDEDSALEVSVAGHGQRITVLPLATDVPELPPLPLKTLTVFTPTALDDALRVCHGIVNRSYFGKPSEHVGLKVDGEWLILRTFSDPTTHAAQAVVECRAASGVEPMPDAHHSFMRCVGDVLGHGSVEFGTVDVDGSTLLSVRGDGWAAWTTRILAPAERHAFAERDGQITVTARRTSLQSVAIAARKLRDAGRYSRRNDLLTFDIGPGELQVRMAPGSDISFSPAPLEAQVEPPERLSFHVSVDSLLTAIGPLRDQWISLHVLPDADKSSAIYVTSAGFRQGEKPPAAVAFMSALLPADATD